MDEAELAEVRRVLKDQDGGAAPGEGGSRRGAGEARQAAAASVASAMARPVRIACRGAGDGQRASAPARA